MLIGQSCPVGCSLMESATGSLTNRQTVQRKFYPLEIFTNFEGGDTKQSTLSMGKYVFMFRTISSK